MCRNLYQASSILVALGVPLIVLGVPVPKEDAKDTVKAFFEQVEKGSGDTAPLFSPPAKDVVTELGQYLKSGSSAQQGHAVRLIAVLGERSNDNEVRSLAVKTLISYATSEGGPNHAARQALDALLRFSKADFPAEAATKIEKLVRLESPPSESLLLAGVLGLQSVKDHLESLTKVDVADNDKRAFRYPEWSAHLALARLGDKASLKHCIQAVQAEKSIVQRVRHFDELVFTRQPEAVKLITRHLFSDERLPQLKPTVPGMPVALYALNALAKAIEGFPIASEPGLSYTEEQIATARKWVKEQKVLTLKR